MVFEYVLKTENKINNTYETKPKQFRLLWLKRCKVYPGSDFQTSFRDSEKHLSHNHS